MTLYTLSCSVLAGIIVYYITKPVHSKLPLPFKKKDKAKNRRLENFYGNLSDPSEKLPSYKKFLEKRKKD